MAYSFCKPRIEMASPRNEQITKYSSSRQHHHDHDLPDKNLGKLKKLLLVMLMKLLVMLKKMTLLQGLLPAWNNLLLLKKQWMIQLRL